MLNNKLESGLINASHTNSLHQIPLLPAAKFDCWPQNPGYATIVKTGLEFEFGSQLWRRKSNERSISAALAEVKETQARSDAKVTEILSRSASFEAPERSITANPMSNEVR